MTEVPDTTELRVTVNLNTKSVEALNAVAALTEDTKTDVINKALQVWVIIQRAQARGGGVWMQDAANVDPVYTKYL